jgi:leucyl/phenylalanyl-tRNA--protein transferase
MSDSVPLDPQTILSAYARGFFPMAGRDGRIGWYTADPRGVIPLDTFHVPHTLRPLVNRTAEVGGFEVRINFDFPAIMRACGRDRDDGTWINEELVCAYTALHKLGFAHSLEAWKDGKLAGGLYGVSLGGAFFGESMFHRVRDASKVALVHLVNRLKTRGYELLDTQATTPHLEKFGCVEIPAKQYLVKLRAALKKECWFAENAE